MAPAKKQTFIVDITDRQKATWQGKVTWVDETKTVPFQSTLEMINLIGGTLEKSAPVPPVN